MSDLFHSATADASAGDHPLHPLVIGLRQRHAKLSARDDRVRPFELRLPDRTAYLIGHDDNDCLINGWADRTLGRLGLFRGLE